jgi:hypothetical protein
MVGVFLTIESNKKYDVALKMVSNIGIVTFIVLGEIFFSLVYFGMLYSRNQYISRKEITLGVVTMVGICLFISLLFLSIRRVLLLAAAARNKNGTAPQ